MRRHRDRIRFSVAINRPDYLARRVPAFVGSDSRLRFRSSTCLGCGCITGIFHLTRVGFAAVSFLWPSFVGDGALHHAQFGELQAPVDLASNPRGLHIHLRSNRKERGTRAGTSSFLGDGVHGVVDAGWDQVL